MIHQAMFYDESFSVRPSWKTPHGLGMEEGLCSPSSLGGLNYLSMATTSYISSLDHAVYRNHGQDPVSLVLVGPGDDGWDENLPLLWERECSGHPRRSPC